MCVAVFRYCYFYKNAGKWNFSINSNESYGYNWI